MSPAKPKMFGNWEVIRKEGSGGFASAYLARHIGTGQKAIIKQMDPHENNKLGARDKDYFKREATILHQLNSKYISALIDWDLRPAKPWMAIQYFPGTTLADYINQGSVTNEAQWFQMAHDILSGLAHAHKKGVVHRDLNPKNIILYYDGARLIDFGLSRFTEDPNATRVVGFDGFVAPEIGQGNPKPPYDIFVAATALCAAGTGRMPWRSTGGNYYTSITQDVPDYKGLTQNQIALLTQMHYKDPSQRITAEQALKIIEELAPSTAGVQIAQPKKVRPVTPSPTFKENVNPKENAEKLIKTPVVNVNLKFSKTSESVFDWIKEHKAVALFGLVTGGWGLIPYFALSIWSKSKHLTDKSKIVLSFNYALMFLSFGILSPFINFFWYYKTKYRDVALLGIAQIALVIAFFVGASLTPNGGTLPAWTIIAFFGMLLTPILSIKRHLFIVTERQQEKPNLGLNQVEESKKEGIQRKTEAAQTASASFVVEPEAPNPEYTKAHANWQEVEEAFYIALIEVGKKRFVIGIDSNHIKGIFFQGYSEPDGAFTIEAAADLSVRPKITIEQRANLNSLGWDSPDEGLPNFIQFLTPENSTPYFMARLFSDTLKNGYGLNIGTFKVVK